MNQLGPRPAAGVADSDLVCPADTLDAALAALHAGVYARGGLTVLVGDAAVGSAILARMFLNELRLAGAITVHLRCSIDAIDPIQAIARALGRPDFDDANDPALATIGGALAAHAAVGTLVVLLVEDAHALDPLTLERIGSLSRIGDESGNLLQIVLIGRPEIDEMLADPAMPRLEYRAMRHARLDDPSSPPEPDTAAAPESLVEVPEAETHQAPEPVPATAEIIPAPVPAESPVSSSIPEAAVSGQWSDTEYLAPPPEATPEPPVELPPPPIPLAAARRAPVGVARGWASWGLLDWCLVAVPVLAFAFLLWNGTQRGAVRPQPPAPAKPAVTAVPAPSPPAVPPPAPIPAPPAAVAPPSPPSPLPAASGPSPATAMTPTPVIPQSSPSPAPPVMPAAPAIPAAGAPSGKAESPPLPAAPKAAHMSPPGPLPGVLPMPPPPLPARSAVAQPRPGGPGLLLVARPGDTLERLYRQVYSGLTPPPLSAVAAVNPAPIRPGDVLVFPAPPGGWSAKRSGR